MIMEEVKKYSLKLKGKKEIAKQTWAFYFEKPEWFSFLPGQSMDLLYPEKDDMRTLSIASAPHDNFLLFAMRMRGSIFKEHLKEIPIGGEIQAEGPFGKRFILPEDANTPLVFIAGGIGITPILSMVSHVTHEGLSTPMTLLYSNYSEEDISFREELEELKNENPNFKMIFTLSNKSEAASSWKGEVGRINVEMIKKYVSNKSDSLFLPVGTPQMAISMEEVLRHIGAPAEHIITKKFTGYEK